MSHRISKAAAFGVAAGFLTAALGACAPSAPEAEPAPTTAAFAIDQDFPDPDVLEVDGEYIAFATNSPAVNVQMATSDDVEEWDVSTDDALPDLPAWASEGRTWAPEVSAITGGGYAMYFTAAHTESNKQCIGVAISEVAGGPYLPVEGDPFVCPLEEGGAIDASVFTEDDGTQYLLWKTDGNCCGMDTWIEVAPLTADGTALAGPPTQLFQQTELWEGNLVEAPVLIKHESKYYVFYSANDYGSWSYAIGVASAPSITGPYTKEPDPFLSSEMTEGRYIGPGGQDIVATPEGDVIVFHSWDELMIYRGMHELPLEWDGDVPSVQLP
ncbi:glycoside hydrolase family 43 protein [Microbacterium sp. DT81.1]|uniref:glycoside hydrolase family 43 protein n=1 Tax=Microbacterium sp. DT81.1 TaxID=3393413 RepID=UPI003CFADBAB